MLQPRDARIAKLFKKRIQAFTQVKRVIVFGSRARGDATKESDLDLFIELTELTPSLREQIYSVAWEIGFNNGLVVSTFLASSSSLHKSPFAANPLLHVIEKEGIVV